MMTCAPLIMLTSYGRTSARCHVSLSRMAEATALPPPRRTASRHPLSPCCSASPGPSYSLLLALPGEGRLVEPHGGQVVPADHPVQPSRVAPAHGAARVAVDLGEQHEPRRQFLARRLGLLLLAGVEDLRALLLHGALDRERVAADPVVR